MQTLYLCGHRKSGTTLFTSLFDNHRDFLVYPTDLTLLYAYYPYFNNNAYSYEYKKKRIQKILNQTIQRNLEYSNQKVSKNIKLFIKNFLSQINKKNINNINFILNRLKKNYIDSFSSKSEKYFVVKETSSDIFFQKIFKKKDKKFIHLLRDPRDNFSSLKSGLNVHYKSLGETKYILLSSMINRLKLDFYFAKSNQKYYGKNNYLIIKFEDLTKYPKKTMKKVCKFLRVDFNARLLEPSIFGKLSTGNNFNQKLKKISSKNVSNWKNRINTEELSLIEFYFQNELKEFEYVSKKFNFKFNNDYIIKFYSWMNKNFYFKDSIK